MAKKVNIKDTNAEKAKSVSVSSTPQYTTLRNGSTGGEVKAMQNRLISAGYDLGSSGADGVYGSKTAAAVKQYQKDNGLTVDGIAGNQTLGSLYSSNGKKTTTPTTPAATTTPKTTTTTTKPTTTTTTKPTTTTTADKTTTTTAKQPEATKTTKTETQPFTYDPFSYDKEFTYDPFSYGEFSYGSYTPSDAVNQANAMLQQTIANKPGAYQSQWQQQINDKANEILNREDFSYNFNDDALYQLYRDTYIQQGQMAMMDTMGQAAAMSGGYGNSYAQTAGQQAYNQQLNQLNDIIPQLYQSAYDRYVQEGQDLYNQYGLLNDRENTDYSRYMDTYNMWTDERDYATNRYNSERDFDYNQYTSDRNFAYNQYSDDRNLAYDQYSSDRNLAYDQYTSDRNLAYDQYTSDKNLSYDQYVDTMNREYQAERDAVSDSQWQAEFDEDTRRYEQNRADEMAAAAAKSSSGGGGSGTEKTGGREKSLTADEQRKIESRFEDAKGNPDAILFIANDLISQGYGEDWVKNIAQYYDKTDGNANPTGVPTANPTAAPFVSQYVKDQYIQDREEQKMKNYNIFNQPSSVSKYIK